MPSPTTSPKPKTSPAPDSDFHLTLIDTLNRVPGVAKLFFTENLRVMIHAGLPIGRALSTIALQLNHKTFKKIILSVRLDVEQGIALSTALAKHPSVFPRYYIAMVAAGEASGKLDDVFIRLTTQMKKEHALRAKVKNALIYPIIVLIGMIGVSIVMLVAVLPKITDVFKESGAKLPTPTRILIGVSDFLIHNGVLTTLGVIVLITLFIFYRRSPGGRNSLDRLTLRLPIIGTIAQKINLASFTRSLHSLLSTDIPIVQTFQIIANTLGNSQYQLALLTAAEKLKTGSSVVKTLETSPTLFPPIVTQMMTIGEESGSLEEIAGEVAQFYEDDVDQTMANLSTILEPIIILLLGLGVVGVALSVILPIYSLGNQIS